MDCFCINWGQGSQSPEDLVLRERRRIHDDIEKELRSERKRRQREHRVLLLGCGEAGKSTFIKQMRIIHSEGFSLEERMLIKQDMALNVISAIQTLLQHTTGEWGEERRLEQSAMLVESLPTSSSSSLVSLVQQHSSHIQRLWHSEAIQSAYALRSSFQLVECASYFLDRVSLVFEEEYVPNDQDVVQTRVRTTGIVEHDFDIVAPGERRRKLILIDVGGQRSERKKWIHCFEDVMLILFLTAVSEYDQLLAEDETTNRMQESLRLFKTIVDYHWFANTPIILFLNKMDLLRDKIQHSPLHKHFKDYNGPAANYDSLRMMINLLVVFNLSPKAALDFFASKFASLNPNPSERPVYVHPTCATDTENMNTIDVVVQDVIMKNILKDAMIS